MRFHQSHSNLPRVNFMKKFFYRIICLLLAVLFTGVIAACSASASPAAIQTAIAGTLAAAPPQVTVVTQVVDITNVVVFQVSATPRPTSAATNTPSATMVPSNTATLAFTPTATPYGVKASATSAATIQPGKPLGLTLTYFFNTLAAMTDLQKKEYVQTLPGKLVNWTGSVDNVTIGGLVMVKLPPPFMGSITLKGVPKDVALKIDRDNLVEFTGMIESINEDYNLQLVVTGVKVIRAYPPPTLTPTPLGWRGR
jgi:hypothetical protein